MGRLLGCIGCFFQGTDHILTQKGRGMGRLLGCISCFFKGTDHILGCIGCLFKGTDHILTQLGRGMGRLLGCIGCSFQDTDHIRAQLGRGMGRLLGCSGCFFQGTDHVLTQLGMERLHLEGPKSYLHPIRERNKKAPWLQRLFFRGHRSYPQWEGFLGCSGCLFQAQLGRGTGRLLDCSWRGPKHILSQGEAWDCFSRARIISSPN